MKSLVYLLCIVCAVIVMSCNSSKQKVESETVETEDSIVAVMDTSAMIDTLAMADTIAVENAIAE